MCCYRLKSVNGISKIKKIIFIRSELKWILLKKIQDLSLYLITQMLKVVVAAAKVSTYEIIKNYNYY